MNIFKWDDFREWERVVRGLMGNHLNDAVIARFKEEPPDYVVSDDLSWLDSVVRKVNGVRRPDSAQLLTRKLLEYYTHITAFHGCRPTSIETYTEFGLQACDPAKMQEVAVQIFGDNPKVWEAIEHLKGSSFEHSYEEHNQGKVYFTLTQEEIVDYCGHYLLYGSEYLLCIANSIGAARKLRERGRATIIECNVPITRIGHGFIKELAGSILEKMFERVLDPESSMGSGFGFYVKGSLPAESIASFHFPRQIPNPHNGRRLED
ncbi:hypothetical protein SAMN02745166_03499 [Prosthecobacter debontii]|uniref:Uncharacterized protein n=1 Tax=Prosthecobacter debontii TaxID=48467 RepID=A0A1T4YJD6_9BACT|nr:hypothetical protein [Prosthecobacter debontii]SKB01902.1 hypothetical protein SAMN02745166_03499 [Prosthecobacter debontii]